MRFKKITAGNFFTLSGKIKEVTKGIYETRDENEIEALKTNKEFEEVKDGTVKK